MTLDLEMKMRCKQHVRLLGQLTYRFDHLLHKLEHCGALQTKHRSGVCVVKHRDRGVALSGQKQKSSRRGPSCRPRWRSRSL